MQKYYNNGMKIYHGSKRIINKPLVRGSNSFNDYGPAFYATRDMESAHKWACKNGSTGYVNSYEFNARGLNVLDLTDRKKYSVLNWLAILMHYRKLDKSFINNFHSRLEHLEDNYYIDVTQYDFVVGYRADDAYFRFPLDFIRGNITLEQLEKSFELGKLGIQYVLISDRAINRLTYLETISSNAEYIGKYFDNVRNATDRYNNLSKDEEGTRIFDIMRGRRK